MCHFLHHLFLFDLLLILFCCKAYLNMDELSAFWGLISIPSLNVFFFCLIFSLNETTGTQEFGFSELSLAEAYPDLMDLPELDYEYQAIVGIPSEEFRHLIMHLHYFGQTGTYHLRYFLRFDGNLQTGIQNMRFLLC